MSIIMSNNIYVVTYTSSVGDELYTECKAYTDEYNAVMRLIGYVDDIYDDTHDTHTMTKTEFAKNAATFRVNHLTNNGKTFQWERNAYERYLVKVTELEVL